MAPVWYISAKRERKSSTNSGYKLPGLFNVYHSATECLALDTSWSAYNQKWEGPSTSLQCPKWLLVQRLNHCSGQNPEILSDRNGFVWKWGTSILFGGLWFFPRLEQPFGSIGSIPSFLETPDESRQPPGAVPPLDWHRSLPQLGRGPTLTAPTIARSQRVTVNKKEWDWGCGGWLVKKHPKWQCH